MYCLADQLISVIVLTDVDGIVCGSLNKGSSAGCRFLSSPCLRLVVFDFFFDGVPSSTSLSVGGLRFLPERALDVFFILRFSLSR